jgi:hypothetical protein
MQDSGEEGFQMTDMFKKIVEEYGEQEAVAAFQKWKDDLDSRLVAVEKESRETSEDHERMETLINEIRDSVIFRLEERIDSIEKRLYMVTKSRGGTITTTTAGVGPDMPTRVHPNEGTDALLASRQARIDELEDALRQLFSAETYMSSDHYAAMSDRARRILEGK